MKRPTKQTEDGDVENRTIMRSSDDTGVDDEKVALLDQHTLLDQNGGKKEGEGDDSWMTDTWHPANVAIPLSYFCVGFALNFLSTPLTYYMVHVLDASPAQQSVVRTMQSLPWSFKLAYGFLSDCVPIRGMRRKPYFILGWTIYLLCHLTLAALIQPSIGPLTSLLFLGTVGYMMADVMTDAIVVERSQHESDDERGTIQAQGYIIRFVGSILGSAMGAVLYNRDTWGWGLTTPQMFALNAFVPFVVLYPAMAYLRDASDLKPIPVPIQCREIWGAVQKRNIWQPMAFIFAYNVMQIPNAAWSSFLIDGLNFSDFSIGVISVTGSVVSWLGLVVYKKFFFNTNWRGIYLWTTLITMFFSVLQLVLIFQLNQKWGIPNLWFALGDDAAAEFILAIQFLPMCIMYLGLCPGGAEGTTYSMLTTFSNVAGTVAYDIGTLMTHIWDVSNDAFAAKDYSGMWKLTLLTSVLQVLPMGLLWLIPGSPAEQRELQKSDSSNFWGGFLFLAVLFGSLVWTVIESIYEIMG
ncbi:unnamed protein product [Heterosigma akashiwo]|mmetsp:Transcript_21004/g.28892  ORF Transcript_21004/g.28892 Transcript_21004/m.28892 type:complete len:522 (+) Transcript_21004:59-1624(+)